MGVVELLATSVSLAVAAIPEGLTAVGTVALAVGMKRLHHQGIQVRDLKATETLGGVQVLCLDKTGTVTENQMQVTQVHLSGNSLHWKDGSWTSSSPQPADGNQVQQLLEAAVGCNEASLEGNRGSPTELALLRLAQSFDQDVSQIKARLPHIKTKYRTEKKPGMRTYHHLSPGTEVVFLKGTPDYVLAKCGFQLTLAGVTPLTNTVLQDLRRANDTYARQGLRVLGLAKKTQSASPGPAAFGPAVPGPAVPNTNGYTWLGLVAMQDQTRPGVDQLVDQLHRAGIRTVLLTGDQKITAATVAHELGVADGNPIVVTDAGELQNLSDQEKSDRILATDVFSRVSPSDKLQIVQSLQRHGLVVGMTGDGINDGPALRAANVGIAMGIAGTETAKDAADVIIERDDLQSLLMAVELGRKIRCNLKSSLHFMLTTNSAEIAVTVGAIAFGQGIPFTPKQLLWINLMTDVFPALALALARDGRDVMGDLPSDPRYPLVESKEYKGMFAEAGLMAGGVLGAQFLARRGTGSAIQGRGAAMNALIAQQMIYAWMNSRGARRSLHTERDYWVPAAAGLGMALQLAAQLLPGWSRLLGLAKPNRKTLVPILLGGLGPLLVIKMFQLRRRRYHDF